MNITKHSLKSCRDLFKFSALALAVNTICIGSVAVMMQNVHAEVVAYKAYNIQKGTLANVLNQFATQSNISTAIDATQANK